MATLDSAGAVSGGGEGILDRAHTIAKAGFNRWLVPPAALCIHLCIGMAYGFSVFWLPLSRAIGTDGAEGLPRHVAGAGAVHHDLRLESCQHGLDVHAVLRRARRLRRDLGRLAGARRPAQGGLRRGALLGRRPRDLGAVGIYVHQLWIMWLGSGVIGGIGLGLGYISPVSTLIKWFPDRRGMATGMAIMGFGGGAMIGAPLAEHPDELLQDADRSVGVWQTFVAMGVIYFVFMMIGAFGYRVPPAGWQPDGWTPPSEKKSMISEHHVHLRRCAQDAAVLADLVGAVA